jgi:hypothetical protein
LVGTVIRDFGGIWCGDDVGVLGGVAEPW